MRFTPVLALAASVVVASAATAGAAVNYEQIKADNAAFIASAQLPSGALTIHPSGNRQRILPYDANLAVAGMLTAGADYCPHVRAWLEWYLGHLNWPDRFGVYATVYDWQVDTWSGAEWSLNDYDSADSYAATFVSAVRAYAERCGEDAMSWASAEKYAINSVGHVMTDPSLQSPSALTWAKPNDRVLFNMDNSEVYAGLVDAAWLAAFVWSDPAEYGWYGAHAARLKRGYDGELWLADQGAYSPARAAGAPPEAWSPTRWFPDATTQVYPIRFGVIDAGSARAANLWNRLKGSWPAWIRCSMAGPEGGAEPFSEIGHAAAMLADRAAADAYLTNCGDRWAGFRWPYNVRHAGVMAVTADLASRLP